MKLVVAAAAVLLAFVAPSGASPGRSGAAPHWRTELGSQSPGLLNRTRDLELRVSYTRAQAPGEHPRFAWKLRLRNRTAKAIHLVFGSSKFADVHVVSRRGVVVYRWSRGKAFLAAITTRRLGPHAVYTRTLGPEEIDIESLQPGEYVLRAFLATARPDDPNRPLAETRRSFWVFPAADDTPLRH